MNKKNIDPVCGMELSGVSHIAKTSYQGKDFGFCGDFCRGRFNNNSEKFTGEPLIKLRDVKKIFKIGITNTQALRGLDLHIWPGDFVVIIGASGSGKSTALNMIGLLDRPTSGKIFLKGEDTSTITDMQRAALRSKTFGFVFQQYNLMPWLTAYENVTIPLIFAGIKIDKEKLEAGFREVGLEERMQHRPFELSGGEQQRVALLRALANEPEIILGDEPTGNLDSKTGNRLLGMLVKLNKIKKKTLVIVTHDTDIAKMADQVITIKDGQMAGNHETHKNTSTE